MAQFARSTLWRNNMIYFYAFDNSLITSLDNNDVSWLVKFHYLKMGNTGSIKTDSPETLPLFDDYIITLENISNMKKFMLLNKNTLPLGFTSASLDKLLLIIKSGESGSTPIKVKCD